MRLFVALDLPDPILQTLETLTARLKPAADIRWRSVSNLHITTKFIGEWPGCRLGELKSALEAMPRTGPFRIAVEGLGWFPNSHVPRVFWAGVGPLLDGRGSGGALHSLARATDKATAALGVVPETRDFHPHLTLGRIKRPVDLEPLRQAVAGLEGVKFGEFEARSQFLYLSQSSVYTKLEEFPLGGRGC